MVSGDEGASVAVSSGAAQPGAGHEIFRRDELLRPVVPPSSRSMFGACDEDRQRLVTDSAWTSKQRHGAVPRNDQNPVTGLASEEVNQLDQKRANLHCIKALVQLQSLLQKLKQQDVRDSFLAGDILKARNPEELLLSLDTMAALLFPLWTADDVSRTINNQVSATTFFLLYEMSSDVFRMSMNTKIRNDYTYAVWMVILSNIIDSTYWSSPIVVPAVTVVMEELRAEDVTANFSVQHEVRDESANICRQSLLFRNHQDSKSDEMQCDASTKESLDMMPSSQDSLQLNKEEIVYIKEVVYIKEGQLEDNVDEIIVKEDPLFGNVETNFSQKVHQDQLFIQSPSFETSIGKRCSTTKYPDLSSSAKKSKIGYVFKTKDELNCQECHYANNKSVHLKSHIEDKFMRYKCYECDYTTNAPSLFKIHYDNIHNKTFLCTKCDYVAIRASTLQKHIDRKHNIRNLQCTECDYVSTKETFLKKHIASKHRKIQRFQCTECDFVTTKPAILRRHIGGTHC